MQYSTVQCSTVQYRAVQYSTVQYSAQWASPFTVAWTEPFVQIYTNIFKILENIWSDFKNICSKLTRPELGKGVKVPSKVKDKQLLEVVKQYCKKVTQLSLGQVRPAGGAAGPLSGDQMDLK